jgi:hypothetical protein
VRTAITQMIRLLTAAISHPAQCRRPTITVETIVSKQEM